jgi:hypothetical protein
MRLLGKKPHPRFGFVRNGSSSAQTNRGVRQGGSLSHAKTIKRNLCVNERWKGYSASSSSSFQGRSSYAVRNRTEPYG